MSTGMAQGKNLVLFGLAVVTQAAILHAYQLVNHDFGGKGEICAWLRHSYPTCSMQRDYHRELLSMGYFPKKSVAKTPRQ